MACGLATPQEDEKDSSIWFLDHSYHEQMYAMFKKINAKEVVVGWYSTGPKLREADLGLHELIASYSAVPNPVLVIIDVQPKELGDPTKAYCSVDQVPPVAVVPLLAHCAVPLCAVVSLKFVPLRAPQ